jgi:carbamate kinase
MGNVLGFRLLMILTAVPKVSINFGTPEQKELDYATMKEMRQYKAEGHFPPGSMGPKVDAALRFLEGGGQRVIIASLEEAMPALRGESGTHIVALDD